MEGQTSETGSGVPLGSQKPDTIAEITKVTTQNAIDKIMHTDVDPRTNEPVSLGAKVVKLHDWYQRLLKGRDTDENNAVLATKISVFENNLVELIKKNPEETATVQEEMDRASLQRLAPSMRKQATGR